METCTKVSTRMDSLTGRVNTSIATVLFTQVTLRIIWSMVGANGEVTKLTRATCTRAPSWMIWRRGSVSTPGPVAMFTLGNLGLMNERAMVRWIGLTAARIVANGSKVFSMALVKWSFPMGVSRRVSSKTTSLSMRHRSLIRRVILSGLWISIEAQNNWSWNLQGYQNLKALPEWQMWLSIRMAALLAALCYQAIAMTLWHLD